MKHTGVTPRVAEGKQVESVQGDSQGPLFLIV